MSLHHFSRRRLLCSLLPGLAAWLCPRPPRAAATPNTESTNIVQPNPPFSYTVYSYDADGNRTIGSCITYVYDRNGDCISVQGRSKTKRGTG